MNISDGVCKETCRDQLLENGALRLGKDETLSQIGILFYLVGMTFGCSYSLLKIDCIDWVRTRLHKRLIRGFVAIVIYCLFLLFFDWFGHLDVDRMF